MAGNAGNPDATHADIEMPDIPSNPQNAPHPPHPADTTPANPGEPPFSLPSQASPKATSMGNAGGALRGQARADQVQARNAARKAARPPKPSH